MNIYGHSRKRSEKALQNEKRSVMLSVRKGGWVTCPACNRNKHFLRIDPQTEAKDFPVYCRDCKRESILNIEPGQRVELRSQ